MTNAKIVSVGLISVIVMAMITGILELNEEFYTLAGLGFLVFGIWASIILWKLDK
jgi:hypothetical protein